MSSCVLVAISGAWDFDIRLGLGRGACACLALGTTGWPGIKTGASAANDPSDKPSDAGIFEVSCPPNALEPLIIGWVPPLLPPLCIPPLPLPRIPPLFEFEFVFEGVEEACSGAIEAGRKAKEAFEFGSCCAEAFAEPPLPLFPPLPPRRLRNGLLRAAGGGGASTADIVVD